MQEFGHIFYTAIWKLCTWRKTFALFLDSFGLIYEGFPRYQGIFSPPFHMLSSHILSPLSFISKNCLMFQFLFLLNRFTVVGKYVCNLPHSYYIHWKYFQFKNHYCFIIIYYDDVIYMLVLFCFASQAQWKDVSCQYLMDTCLAQLIQL